MLGKQRCRAACQHHSTRPPSLARQEQHAGAWSPYSNKRRPIRRPRCEGRARQASRHHGGHVHWSCPGHPASAAGLNPLAAPLPGQDVAGESPRHVFALSLSLCCRQPARGARSPRLNAPLNGWGEHRAARTASAPYLAAFSPSPSWSSQRLLACMVAHPACSPTAPTAAAE